MSKCVECMECVDEGVVVDAILADPRQPPLDTGVCLCQTCYNAAAAERIEELGNELAWVIKSLTDFACVADLRETIKKTHITSVLESQFR